MTFAAPDYMLGMSRSMVTMSQFNEQKQDYITSLEGLAPGTPEYQQAIEACHRRGAERCVRVANMHRGLYVKAAQFIASLRGGTGDRGVPKAYTDALAVFTDQAPHRPAAEIAPVLKEAMDVGDWPAQPLDGTHTLASIEDMPVASASLAQVHRAVLKDGSKVAVKVQYPELQKEVASDFAVFRQIGAQLQSGTEYDFLWLVDDFERNLQKELDFRLEGESGMITARQLAHLRPRVYVPHVYAEHSSGRVLTMELCEGLLKANDPAALQAAGLDVEECAELICSTFAEMIFLHGRVHADPHAGNIYIRPIEGTSGRPQPQLVILDHGLYHDLTENDVRQRFCRYWRACCAKDGRVLIEIGEQFAGGLHRFLPLILSPWFVFGGSGVSLRELISAAKGQLPDDIRLQDVGDFIQATRNGGASVIGLLHSLGYVRGLLESLHYPEEKRLGCMARFAVMGDVAAPPTQPRALTRVEENTIWWHLTLLRAQIFASAPLARFLVQHTKMERFPRPGVVAAIVTGLAAISVGLLLAKGSSRGAADF